MGVTASLGTYDSVVYFLGVGHAYALTWDLFPMGRSWTRARIGRARLVVVDDFSMSAFPNTCRVVDGPVGTTCGKRPTSTFPHYVFHISAQCGRFWRRRWQHHTPTLETLLRAPLTRPCDKYPTLSSRFTGSGYHIFVFPWKRCMLFWLLRAPPPVTNLISQGAHFKFDV